MKRTSIARWDSLPDAEREGEMPVTAELKAELDRRWDEHLRDPDSGVTWSEVRRKLYGAVA